MTGTVGMVREASPADYRREGLAEAVVVLVGNRQVPPTVGVTHLAEALGLSGSEVRAALDRVAARTARAQGMPPPNPKGQPPFPDAKWCPYGAHWVDRSGFGLNRSRADGLQTWCRGCRRESKAADHGPALPVFVRGSSRKVADGAIEAPQCHRHGTESCYRNCPPDLARVSPGNGGKGCRCDPCAEANASARRERKTTTTEVAA